MENPENIYCAEIADFVCPPSPDFVEKDFSGIFLSRNWERRLAPVPERILFFIKLIKSLKSFSLANIFITKFPRFTMSAEIIAQFFRDSSRFVEMFRKINYPAFS